MRDRSAGREGVGAGVVEVGRAVALPHRVAERQVGGAAPRHVDGGAARVEIQHGRLPPLRDADGGVKGHGNVDFGARPVQAASGRRVDADYGRRRHFNQLHGAALGRCNDRIRPAAHVKGMDAKGAVKPVKAVHAVGGRAGREQGAVAGAYPYQLDAVVPARGDRGVRGAVDELERGHVKGAVELVKAARAVGRRSQGLQGAVCVHAHQLDAVVAFGGDQGVRDAAHVKGGDAARAVEL